MKNLLRIALAALLVLAGLCDATAAIRVGSVTDARFGTGWTLDGSNMSQARTKLLNAANFGVGGTVPTPIVITDTAVAQGSITASLLANFDVFFIGYLPNSSSVALTPAELGALQTWVTGGGVVITTCDDNNYDAVCATFGHPSLGGSPATSPTVPTAAGLVHPIFAGPFGVVNTVNMAFTEGAFASTSGATVIGQDSSSSHLPTILVQSQGAGKVVSFSDVDMISYANLSAGGSISNDNDRYLGNLFAFAGGAGGVAPPVAGPVQLPTLSESSLLVLMILVGGFALRRVRALRRDA